MLRAILLSTATSYLRIILRMVFGVVTFRLLYENLAAADFGLYQLLWSTVGYVVLLDFGFGAAVQRAVAQGRGRGDEAGRAHARGAVSTAVVCYTLLAAIGCLVVLGTAGSAVSLVTDAPGAGLATTVFLIAVLMAFPLGVFKEALRGAERIHIVNAWEIVGMTLGSSTIIAGSLLGWSLPALLAVSAAGSIVPGLICGLVCLRDRWLRPSLRCCGWHHLRDLGTFGLIAYLITMANVIMAQSDQLSISVILGVEALVLFLPGFKLAQLLGVLANQMQEALAPAAARCHAAHVSQDGEADHQAQVQRLFVMGQRWAIALTIPMALPLLIAPVPALQLLTGLEQPSAEVILTTRLMITATVLMVIGHSVTKRIMMMTGHHRLILGLTLVELAINGGVTVAGLMLTGSVVAAAVGSLTAALILPLPVVLPWCCRRLGVALSTCWNQALLPGVLASLPSILVGLAWWATGATTSLGHLVLGGALIAIAMIIGCWFAALPEAWRRNLQHALRQRVALLR